MSRNLPIALALLSSLAFHIPLPPPTTIAANDNRRLAGRLERGVLTLALEVRDGLLPADLPASQRRPRPAYLLTGPGETADFELTPQAPGDLRLEVKTQLPGWIIPIVVRVR